MDVNKQLNECRNVEILKECASEMLTKIEANSYSNKPEQVNKDL